VTHYGANPHTVFSILPSQVTAAGSWLSALGGVQISRPAGRSGRGTVTGFGSKYRAHRSALARLHARRAAVAIVILSFYLGAHLRTALCPHENAP